MVEITNIYIAILILLVGFVLLIKGADFFVDGSSSVAKRLKIPSIIVGLTIVAMGTSLPETAVSVCASLQGNNSLAISNAVGSNIFNLMVVIGLCGMMTTVPVGKSTIKVDIPLSIGFAGVLLALGIMGRSFGHIDGAILLVFFVGFLVYTIKSIKKSGEELNSSENETEDASKIMPVWLCIICIVGGAAGIAFGGDMVVDAASFIGIKVGMSETLVGLTIVSIGTSLPELVTSIVAAKKNQIGMALGNAIGSNIFNIGMVLGIASAISPIGFITENIIDISILIIFSFVVWAMAAKKREIRLWHGIIMVALYLGYTAYIIIR